jgi:hypothetical protein
VRRPERVSEELKLGRVFGPAKVGLEGGYIEPKGKDPHDERVEKVADDLTHHSEPNL